MNVNHFNVKYLSAFEAQYNDGTKVGSTLVSAQEDGFENEGLGVPISEEELKTAITMSGQKKEKKILG